MELKNYEVTFNYRDDTGRTQRGSTVVCATDSSKARSAAKAENSRISSSMNSFRIKQI